MVTNRYFLRTFKKFLRVRLETLVGGQRQIWEMQIGKASESYCGTVNWLWQYLLIFSSLKNPKIVCEAQQLAFGYIKNPQTHTGFSYLDIFLHFVESTAKLQVYCRTSGVRPFLRIIEDLGGCCWSSCSKSLLSFMKASAYFAGLKFCSQLRISPPEVPKVLIKTLMLG